MNLKDTYDLIAQNWHQDHQNDDWWLEGTNTFISLLKPGNSVLDVGCGGGTKSKYLASKGLEVTGVDFSEKMIEIARKETVQETMPTKFLVMDMANIDKLEEKFDGIFIQAVLLHIPKTNVRKQIEKALERLNNGGYLYIAVKERRQNGPEEEVKTENDYGYQYERFFSYFDLDEIKNHFNDLELNLVYENVSPAGNTNWLQIIGQKNK